jgi:C4-type Zn-finger protein
MDEMPELRCPLCQGTTFEREEERTDSRWGFSTHVKTLLVCDRCRYVLTFYDTNSIFDFD